MIRESALRAAVDLIARQGFAATSMSQVAEAAGISPSGLAHHFPSKKALLGAVLAYRDVMDNEGGLRLDDEPWTCFDQLVDVAAVNSTRHQLVLLYTTMVGEAVTEDHPAHPWMAGHFRDVLASLSACLIRDQELGRVRADAPVGTIARQMVALMDGLQVQWLLDDSVDMVAILRQYVDDLKATWGTTPAA
ncbi:TetR/AcrR family transcriptional regulator [Brachybacterium sp. NBEC-018]|uniref:TetR/AcrR family transcriptional regulator n=1 Tax=Brachybacterium sp. NBEC-018 TaxID=2996004 RepID=UPI0021753833|nr:TetR/AcrR family transcriptional regulator [Brachybacterium sp. NBEC-018]UVY84020.1 TetR/AcrR family transcriptional regulator [Brachybacterium sp. NBEC-018]